MCATWNTDKPSIGNQITADIADIEENLQELHDVIEAITNGTLGTTEPALFAVDSLGDGTTGFASTTCQPFYQNSAPTGWTRKTDLQDTSMFSYAASGNVATGGSASAIAGHTHEYTEVPNHVHVVSSSPAGFERQGNNVVLGGQSYGSSPSTNNPTGGVASGTTSANTAPYYIEMILAAVD